MVLINRFKCPIFNCSHIFILKSGKELTPLKRILEIMVGVTPQEQAVLEVLWMTGVKAQFFLCI